MRFLYSGIGFNIALCGLAITNLAASAAPAPVTIGGSRSPSTMALSQSSTNTIIKGTGVEFAVPSGFQGGPPSSTDTKTITDSAAKMFPSIASFVKLLDADPTFLRAIAINTAQKDPEVVLITRLPVPADVSIDALHDMMAKTLPSMLPPEFKLIDSKIDNIGTRQIVRLTIDADIQGSKFKESIGLFREGNEVFQVTYVYANENLQQAIPIFEGIVTSFKAQPTTPAATTPQG
ncbi:MULTISPECIES: hypothetical protein [unclassified Chamaesiphon]|uniref:hypothetical protein n=1 Tax=unclassified Chamaesiphon TaxID=2620921 RepID=UPI00286D3A99|nr:MULTISPECIES: hypothetical protein [unclassified Chamaesiphon]